MALENEQIREDVQQMRLSDKRYRTKGGTRRERGTTEKQGDIAEVEVLMEELFFDPPHIRETD